MESTITKIKRHVGVMGSQVDVEYVGHDDEGTMFNGHACILFMSHACPRLAWERQLISIIEPERFGAWETRAQQLAYAKKFIGAV